MKVKLKKTIFFMLVMLITILSSTPVFAQGGPDDEMGCPGYTPGQCPTEIPEVVPTESPTYDVGYPVESNNTPESYNLTLTVEEIELKIDKYIQTMLRYKWW